MKRALSLAVSLLLLVSLHVWPAGAASITATSSPDHIALTWTQNPSTTQTISWRTDASVTAGYVQYKPAPDSSFPDGALQAEATVRACETDLGRQHIHIATLTGLSPNTKYAYRVGDGSNWSGTRFFTTADPAGVKYKFIVCGDSQANTVERTDYLPWKTAIHAAFEANPDARFILNLGDLVDIGSSGVEWDEWFDGAAGVIDSVPHMAVVGNHETIEFMKYSPPNAFNSQFEFPQNGPEGLKNQVYSFNYGNVHFVALDSQVDEQKAFVPDILERQTKWLEQDLAANTKPWVIVLMHKPLYHNRGIKANEALKAAFQPIFDKYHVDVVFCAHDHTYSRTYPMYADAPVSSPAKGTVYFCVGRVGMKAFAECYSRFWDAYFYDPVDQPNYLTAEVDGSRLTVKCFKQDGTLVDSYTIDKSTGEDFPRTLLPGRSPTTRLAIYGDLIQIPQLSTDPVNKGGAWYVPLRSFVNYIGGTVTWNGEDRSVTFAVGKTTGTVRQGSTEAVLNGAAVALSNPVDKTASGITLVSADDLKILLGFSYAYNKELNILSFIK